MPDIDEPIFYDAVFRQKRKKGKWRVVEAPALEEKVADTHAHLQMLADPGLSLARCALHGVGVVTCVCDVCEDDEAAFEGVDAWRERASGVIEDVRAATKQQQVDVRDEARVPQVRIIVGCHPHNAKDFDAQAESRLRARLADERVCAIGEIGLDYHYDFSPREVQREVFARQVRIAHELELPIALHIREAHDDALGILRAEGFPSAGTLLHCFNLGPAVLEPFLEHDCYIAFGGPITFAKADEVREAACLVPLDRLLTETDSPYMAPEPMRGVNCGPEHVIFSAARLAYERGVEPGSERAAFLRALYGNAARLLGYNGIV